MRKKKGRSWVGLSMSDNARVGLGVVLYEYCALSWTTVGRVRWLQ